MTETHQDPTHPRTVEMSIDDVSAEAPEGPRSFADRIGAPWAAESMSPQRWAQAILAGTALAWLALDYPGKITAESNAGTLTHLAWAVLLAVLPLIAIVDARTHKIPNRILFPAAALISVLMLADLLVGSMSLGTAVKAVGGGLLLGLYAFVIYFIAPDRGYGWGDVKLTFWGGLVLGSQSIWTAVVGLAVIPPLLALVPMLIISARTGQGGQTRVPFGPFIAAGIVLAAFLGPGHLVTV